MLFRRVDWISNSIDFITENFIYFKRIVKSKWNYIKIDKIYNNEHGRYIHYKGNHLIHFKFSFKGSIQGVYYKPNSEEDEIITFKLNESDLFD